jgi:hypothetical protein
MRLLFTSIPVVLLLKKDGEDCGVGKYLLPHPPSTARKIQGKGSGHLPSPDDVLLQNEVEKKVSSGEGPGVRCSRR